MALLDYFLDPKAVFDLQNIGTFLGVIGLLIFSVLLLDFTIRKNALTLLNTYAVFVFSCSIAMLPGLRKEPFLVISTVFLLLASRRMFSLQSPKNSERKILDASLWIALASVFYFWSFLLFVALFLCITLKPNKKLREYLIPVVGVTAVFLIATAYHFIKDDSFGWFVSWLGDVSFDFSAYAQTRMLLLITFMAAMLVWTVISKMTAITSGSRKERPNQLLELYILGSCLFLVLISSEKTGAEFLFLLPAAAIIISGYIEKKNEKWFKEILLWIFVLLPLLFVFL
jgi:hypothetical protein